MARRRSYASRRLRLQGVERILMIFGATIYLVGALGGLHLLPMPDATAILLLIVGGGLMLGILLSLVF